jgi:tetratricopeptide (TPR) repeat protein
VLERFGGTVEKFIGDAVMAVFGAPVAHEDDAERAVRAALDVRDALTEEGLSVRIAVNTGEALVSLGARPEAGEAMVAGDVVNTAARLQSAAPVDGVLVGEATWRATSRAIEYRDAPAAAAKGKSAPVLCWEAVRPRARYGVDVVQHAETALVGRDGERRLLVDAVDRAARERSLQLVTLVGAPGMGKSRLVWELFHELDGRPGLVASWRQARSLAYGGGAFGAIAEAVRAEAGVLETDAAEDAMSSLAASIADLAADEAEADWLVRRLAPLLGVDAGEQATREEAFSAWQRFFELVAERRPLVLVLEDLHWADEGTLGFVEHLADWSTDSPMLVLCTARPELLERRPSWGGGRVNSQTLSIPPLDDVATTTLLAQVLGTPVIDAVVQQALVAQAGGNPLYAEEFARMTLETGGGGGVPPTVQGVIAARLDVLPAAEKALLQDAAVLGKVFWRGGVEALAGEVDDELLRSLTRKELIRRGRTSALEGETEFAFRHALVRDVAYGQIPRAGRAEKHQLAAEWIAATTAGSRVDLVAHHYAEALELRAAASLPVDDLVPAARVSFRDAGLRSFSLGALAEAADLLRKALDLWATDADDRPQVLFDLARSLVDGTPADAVPLAEEAIAGFAERNDLEQVAAGEVLCALAVWQMGDGGGAVAHLERALAAADAAGSGRARAIVRESRARILSQDGQNELALVDVEDALASAEEAGLDEVALGALITRAGCRSELGQPGWEEDFEAAQARAAELQHPRLMFRSLNNYVHALRMRRGPLACVGLYEELEELVQRFRLTFSSRWVESARGWDDYSRGDWDSALERTARFLAADAGSRHYLDAEVQITRAFVYLGRGRDADALAAFRLGAERSREVGDAQELAPMAGFSAELHLELGDVVEVERARRELVEIVAEKVPGVYDWYLGMGWAARALGGELPVDAPDSVWTGPTRAIAENRLEDAARSLDAIGAVVEGARAKTELARERAAAGLGVEPWASEARAVWTRAGAVRYLRQLDELSAMPRSA